MSKAFGAEAFASPQPDAARVAHLRHTLDTLDEGVIAALAEHAHRELVAGVERLLAEVRTRDIVEAADQLQLISAQASALDPRTLTPRGLAAVFGGRRRALARLIDRFEGACAVADPLTAGLGERLARLRRRVDTLDGLHDQTKAFILEFDAHLEAARQRLAGLDAAHPLRSALERRIGDLAAARRGAVEQLPCVRVVQNVDAPLTRVLGQALEAVNGWRQDWSDRLGLRLDRRVATRPDEGALYGSRAALTDAVDAVLPCLAEASARREEAVARMSRAAEAVRGRR